MAFVGLVCGQVQGRYSRQRKDVTDRNERLQQQLRDLDSELVFLRQAKDELNRLVALRDREQSTLDTGLRWLSASPASMLARNTLSLLSKHTQLTDAAIYYRDSATGLFHREAMIGSEEDLPDQFDATEIPIACIALERKQTVTVPELLRAGAAMHSTQNYLAAVPLITCKEEVFGILLVTGMPFISFTTKSIGLLEIICQWAAGFIEIKDDSLGNYRLVKGTAESCKIYSADFFKHIVRVSTEAFQKQHSVASLVMFVARGSDKSFQAELEQTLAPNLRSGDYATDLGLEIPHLLVLLPLTGERGAGIFMDRVLGGWKNEEHQLLAFHCALEEEQDLTELLENAASAHHEDFASF
jgi:hypothetical protein